MASCIECTGCCKDQCGSSIEIARSTRLGDDDVVDLDLGVAALSTGGRVTPAVNLSNSSNQEKEEEKEEEELEEDSEGWTEVQVAETRESDEKSGKKKSKAEDLEDSGACCGRLLDHHMDELEVMQKTWWCCYCCCCAGCGVGPRDPIRLKCHCGFCQGSCQSADLLDLDGVSHCAWTCCGCNFLSQLPFREDTPHCTICNKHYFGWHKKHDEVDPDEAITISFYEHAIHELFIPCYMLCCGCPIAKPSTETETLCKCCCCRAACGQAVPAEGEFCACLLSFIILHLQCRMLPNMEENPLCALFGKKMRRKRSRFVDHMLGLSEAKSPKQQKMQGHDEFANGTVTLADIPEFE